MYVIHIYVCVYVIHVMFILRSHPTPQIQFNTVNTEDHQLGCTFTITVALGSNIKISELGALSVPSTTRNTTYVASLIYDLAETVSSVLQLLMQKFSDLCHFFQHIF